MTPTDPTLWIKASRSANQGQCVEMRQNGATIEVRDTKDQGDGPTLRFTPTAFSAWLNGAKSSEFDHLM